MERPAKVAWFVRIRHHRLSGGPPHQAFYAAAFEDPEQALQAVMAKIDSTDETFDIVRKLHHKELSELRLTLSEVRSVDDAGRFEA
jgi:hypothetical protein